MANIEKDGGLDVKWHGPEKRKKPEMGDGESGNKILF